MQWQFAYTSTLTPLQRPQHQAQDFRNLQRTTAVGFPLASWAEPSNGRQVQPISVANSLYTASSFLRRRECYTEPGLWYDRQCCNNCFRSTLC